jgi:formamidase
LPPLADNVLLGTLSGPEAERVAGEAARTVPARENGGNHDIKNLTKGSRIYYPVHVPGAKLSGGDLHFSQGDGEITFCGAIEMGGYIDLHVDLIKGGMAAYGVSTNPIFMPGRVEPRYTEFLTFVGISVDHETDTNRYLDATLVYQRACLNAVEYLKKFGYSGEQAYLLLGSAPIEGRISGVVDIPNACCTLYLPTAIFDVDIRPSQAGPTPTDRGSCALTS